MGAVASVVFGLRNIGKCSRGEKARGVVAAEQALSALDATANILQKADGAVESIFEKVGKSEVLDKIVATTGANSKIGAIAQSSINPLLCVSAGIRVLKDDDPKAALVEETSAMATMFGVESLMKYARSSVTGASQATTGIAGKVAGCLNKSETIKNLGEKAGNWFKNLGTTSHGDAKQKLVKAGIDLLFVAGSIIAYNLGHTIGKALSGRGEKD